VEIVAQLEQLRALKCEYGKDFPQAGGLQGSRSFTAAQPQ